MAEAFTNSQTQDSLQLHVVRQLLSANFAVNIKRWLVLDFTGQYYVQPLNSFDKLLMTYNYRQLLTKLQLVEHCWHSFEFGNSVRVKDRHAVGFVC